MTVHTMREKILTTFRQWLTDQESRDDPVGYFAKYWRELPDKPKLSAPASFEKHLQQRGLFEQVPGLAEGWQTVIGEYRQVNAAQNAERMGLTVIRPGDEQQQAPPAMTVELDATADPLLVAVNAKLDLLLAYFGLAQPHQVAGLHVQYRPGAMPVQSWSADAWQAMWDSADHEAVIE